jgi:hypothetical protein
MRAGAQAAQKRKARSKNKKARSEYRKTGKVQQKEQQMG